MTTKTFVEVNSDGLVTHQVVRTADDWDVFQVPDVWLEIADPNVAALDLAGATIAQGGSFQLPSKTPPENPVLVAIQGLSGTLDRILAAVGGK